MNDMGYNPKVDALFPPERKKLTKRTWVILVVLVIIIWLGIGFKEENRQYQMYANVFTELEIVSRTTDMEIVYTNGDTIKLNEEQFARIKSMPNMDFDMIPYYKRVIKNKAVLERYAEIFYYENKETRGSIVLFDIEKSMTIWEQKHIGKLGE